MFPLLCWELAVPYPIVIEGSLAVWMCVGEMEPERQMVKSEGRNRKELWNRIFTRFMKVYSWFQQADQVEVKLLRRNKATPVLVYLVCSCFKDRRRIFDNWSYDFRPFVGLSIKWDGKVGTPVSSAEMSFSPVFSDITNVIHPWYFKH